MPYEGCIPDYNKTKEPLSRVTLFKTDGEELLPQSQEFITTISTEGESVATPNHLSNWQGLPCGWYTGLGEAFDLDEAANPFGVAMRTTVFPNDASPVYFGGYGGLGGPGTMAPYPPNYSMVGFRSPYPYTGATPQSVSNSVYGVNWIFGGVGWINMLGEEEYYPLHSTLNQFMMLSPLGQSFIPHFALTHYFQERGSLYSTTKHPNDEGPFDAVAEGLHTNNFQYDTPVGSWASIGRWADAVFDGQLYPNGLNNGYMSTQWVWNSYGLLQPLSPLNPVGNPTMAFQAFSGGNTPNSQTKNPLGFIREDDAVDDYPTNGYAKWLLGTGNASLLCFLSRRKRPTITVREQAVSRVVHQVDPLFDSIVDPLGYVDATKLMGYAAGDLIQSDINPDGQFEHSNHPWVQQMDQSIGSGGYSKTVFTTRVIAGQPPFAAERALPQARATYQDIKREDLQHDQTYTFTTYVAKPNDSQFQSWGTMSSDGLWDSTNAMNNTATSAIITLSPIDSKTSYTRLVLNLDTEVSAVQKAGTSAGLATDVAARLTKIEFTAPDDPITWYKMEVSLPYDAFEQDRLYQGPKLENENTLGLWDNNVVQTAYSHPPKVELPNYGMRCCIQGYNDYLDGSLPVIEDFFGLPLASQPIDIPALMLVWGNSFVMGNIGAAWIRRPGEVIHPDMNTGIDVCTEVPTFETMMYSASGSILGPDGFAELGVETHRRLNIDKDGDLTYLSPDLSSLEKITLGVPKSTVEGELPTMLITKPNIYDVSGYRVSHTSLVYNDSKRIVLPENSIYPDQGPNINVNGLSVSSGVEGTHINKCIAGVVPVYPRELLHMFRYFNSLGQVNKGSGFSTRVPADSSSIHSVSGGSRVSYRINPDNNSIGTSGSTHSNFTDINIIN